MQCFSWMNAISGCIYLRPVLRIWINWIRIRIRSGSDISSESGSGSTTLHFTYGCATHGFGIFVTVHQLTFSCHLLFSTYHDSRPYIFLNTDVLLYPKSNVIRIHYPIPHPDPANYWTKSRNAFVPPLSSTCGHVEPSGRPHFESF